MGCDWALLLCRLMLKTGVLAEPLRKKTDRYEGVFYIAFDALFPGLGLYWRGFGARAEVFSATLFAAFEGFFIDLKVVNVRKYR